MRRKVGALRASAILLADDLRGRGGRPAMGPRAGWRDQITVKLVVPSGAVAPVAGDKLGPWLRAVRRALEVEAARRGPREQRRVVHRDPLALDEEARGVGGERARLVDRLGRVGAVGDDDHDVAHGSGGAVDDDRVAAVAPEALEVVVVERPADVVLEQDVVLRAEGALEERGGVG